MQMLRPSLAVAHELLFSLMAAWTAVAFHVRWTKPEIRYLRIKSSVNAALDLHPHSSTGADVAFSLYVLFTALLIFALLRVGVGNLVTRIILPWVAVAVALSAPYKVWRDPPGLYPFETGEVAVMVAFSFMWAWRPRMLPTWFVLAILAAHFAWWLWLLAEETASPIGRTLPVIAYISSAVWGMFVAKEPELKPRLDAAGTRL